ncbi:MAG: hypothetical protein QOF69_1386 [Solirubrobacteraceae bacterium]|nr:hypothetical protein [Solirubrobacteraceae bacterium]
MPPVVVEIFVTSWLARKVTHDPELFARVWCRLLHRVTVGETSVDKFPSVLEEHAYRDTWGRGRESYLSMKYERLVADPRVLAAQRHGRVRGARL